MSDHTHSAPRRGSFGRVVGLFLLVVVAALVGLYFYSLEARRAGDEAIGQARSYKRTIVADYKRFYECMRSGGAAGSGTTTASAGTAKAEGAASPPGPFSGNVPEEATTPSPAGVPPTVVADAPAGMVADAPGGAAPGEVMTPSGPAKPAAPGLTASSDGTAPAGVVVYPPYPDYPVYPQAADQSAAHSVGTPGVPPSPGQYPPPQAEVRDHGDPAYDARPAHARGPEIAQVPVPVQPPMADQSAGGAQTPAAGTNLPQPWPQQPGPGMQAGTEPQFVAALPAQGAERTAGNYPYRAAPNWQAPGTSSYGAYGYRGMPPARAQGPQPPVSNRAYSYSGYGTYPYYQGAPAYPQRAYPEQPQPGASGPGTATRPGQEAQQGMQPTPPAQGMAPWQGTQSWQAASPWQGIQSGQRAGARWQGVQRPYADMPPGARMQQAPVAMQPQAGQDGNPQYGPGGQGAQRYAPAADWQAPPGTAYGARAELAPNAPPSVRYDQLTASPPPGGPVMQGAAAPSQDPLPSAPVPGATVGGAPPSSYSGSSAPQQWVPYAAAPAPAPYASAQGYAPQRAPLQPAPSVGPVGSEMNPLVASARQAYSSQRYQDAINSYRTLIAKGDDSPAVYGELGNVLLAAGRPQEAAQAYYEASSRLIDKGQPASVYLLLSHIETYDPLLGAILNRRLASLPRSLN